MFSMWDMDGSGLSTFTFGNWRAFVCPVALSYLQAKMQMGPFPAQETGVLLERGKGANMSEVVYTSKIRMERKVGPLRIAYLPGEAEPVIFSVHGAIAEHYKVNPATIKESHASTIDYVIAATAG
jgi:hypothetical protein